MMIKYITLLVLLSGCLESPGSDIEYNKDIHKVYYQDGVLVYANGELNDYYGKSGRSYEKVEVFWADTPCPYRPGWSVIDDGVCLAGKMFGCGEMYVAMNERDVQSATCNTALVHEFGHCWLMDHGIHNRVMHDHYTNKEEKDAKPPEYFEFWEGILKDIKLFTCDRGW